MVIATHKKIAGSAYDMFDSEIQELVDKSAFIEGSYYPDVNIKYTVLSHDYDGTIDIIKEKIDEILSTLQSPKALGKKLGIICHFIADYCSPYHVNKKYKDHSIIRHLRYERKTNRNLDFVLLDENDMSNTFFESISTLPEDMEVFIAKYMQSEKNMKAEVKHSLINTFHIISMIMAEYINLHIDIHNYIDIIPLQDIPSVPHYAAVDAIASAIYDEIEY